MAKLIWIEDRGAEGLSVLQRGRAPRVAGADVYEVAAATRKEAERLVRRASLAEPDQDADPAAWAEWKQAAKRVRRVEPEEMIDA